MYANHVLIHKKEIIPPSFSLFPCTHFFFCPSISLTPCYLAGTPPIEVAQYKCLKLSLLRALHLSIFSHPPSASYFSPVLIPSVDPPHRSSSPNTLPFHPAFIHSFNKIILIHPHHKSETSKSGTLHSFNYTIVHPFTVMSKPNLS